MLGFIVALFLSWLLLKFTVREPVTVLGIIPNPRRMLEFLVGLGFLAAVGLINFLWQAHFKEISYQPNPNYGLGEMLRGAYVILKGVVFEEVAFRGALLYLLIRYLGIVKACLLSSLVFGVYHWFSYEVLGERLILMIYILLVTGAGGWMFAFAFAKTRSMFAGTGLHLGWNLVAAIVFSAGPVGDQWLLPQGDPVQTSDWVTLIFFTLQAIVAPGIVTWYLQKAYRPAGTGEWTERRVAAPPDGIT
ncbi:MAG: CPBP family intramembrane glutamic endopeptidase [Pseudomonadota bacterium]